MADPLTDTLSNAAIAQPLKAAAWDAFQSAANEDELAAKLKDLNIPKSLKADLWDLKAKSAVPTAPPGSAPISSSGCMARSKN